MVHLYWFTLLLGCGVLAKQWEQEESSSFDMVESGESDLLQEISELGSSDEDTEKMILGHHRRPHHRHCDDSSSSSDHRHHHRKPCKTTTSCVRPTTSCCRRTTTDKVTTYVLRRTTTTSFVTKTSTATSVTTSVSKTTSSVFITDSTTITRSTTLTSSTTSTTTFTKPNTTFTLSKTTTTTLPNKTIVSIVTQEIMPCFTQFETCFYNCPYYEIEPTGCGCEERRPRPTACCGQKPRHQEEWCPLMNLAQENGYRPCCEPSRLYVLPAVTNCCTVRPTYEPIPPCGCWNPPAPQTVTVTVRPAPTYVPQQCCPPQPSPVTVTVQPNVFCTTEIVCAYYTPLGGFY